MCQIPLILQNQTYWIAKKDELWYVLNIDDDDAPTIIPDISLEQLVFFQDSLKCIEKGSNLIMLVKHSFNQKMFSSLSKLIEYANENHNIRNIISTDDYYEGFKKDQVFSISPIMLLLFIIIAKSILSNCIKAHGENLSSIKLYNICEGFIYILSMCIFSRLSLLLPMCIACGFIYRNLYNKYIDFRVYSWSFFIFPNLILIIAGHSGVVLYLIVLMVTIGCEHYKKRP